MSLGSLLHQVMAQDEPKMGVPLRMVEDWVHYIATALADALDAA